MRFVRFQQGTDAPSFGWVYENYVGPLEGSVFDYYRRLDASIPIDRVRLFSPVEPGKIICVGRNYVEHAREHDAEIPDIPLLFLKPPSSVIGHGAAIVLPPQSSQVEHEAELAVVIGRRARWVEIQTAMDYVFGYTIANDVTARDLQRRDGQWTRGKGFDTFCPLGPWIETELDSGDILISSKVNGELRQMASTRDMVFSIAQLIVFASSVMTLFPGDVILTGTPAGVGPLIAGDTVTVTIEGIGELSNPVISTY